MLRSREKKMPIIGGKTTWDEHRLVPTRSETSHCVTRPKIWTKTFSYQIFWDRHQDFFISMCFKAESVTTKNWKVSKLISILIPNFTKPCFNQTNPNLGSGYMVRIVRSKLSNYVGAPVVMWWNLPMLILVKLCDSNGRLFCQLFLQQSDYNQNLCFINTSHMHCAISTLRKSKARPNLVEKLNCLKIIGFLEIGWHACFKACWLKNKEHYDLAHQVVPRGSFDRFCAAGRWRRWERSISGVQISGADIWGALPSVPCRHLLLGPSILWQRKQKIIISVKLGMGK